VEILSRVGQWLLAVMDHWELIVGSGVVAFVLDLIEKLFGWKMPRKHYAIFVGVGLVMAMFSAWNDEHKAVETAKAAQQAAETKLKTQQPKLEGVIEQTIYGEKSTTHTGMAFLEVEVKNTGGSPSIAEGYLSEIKCGETIHQARLDMVPDAPQLHRIFASLHLPKGPLEIGPLYRHSGAILPGDHIRGWLLLDIPDVKNAHDLAIPSCVWVVSFADIHGNRYEATRTYTGTERKGLQYLPPTP
jgi:hypothetical protein